MPGLNDETWSALRQVQFLDVVSRDEAERRFRQHLTLAPLGTERVPVAAALQRVLGEKLVAPLDVPGFDRSNVDGFAVQAEDTRGALEETPRWLRLASRVISPGVVPDVTVERGCAVPLATGAMVPRGADAAVMLEDTDVAESLSGMQLRVQRACAPGDNITFAGTDVARGETVYFAGQLLTSREIGVLAALGLPEVTVYRRPRVAILSTGDEIVPPGQPRPPAGVYDSNAAILSASVAELGGHPVCLGTFPDDLAALEAAFVRALSSEFDAVLLSGGTSKGAGDLSYRVVGRLQNPGIVVHGVALKPGKPVCLAVEHGKPVVVLPGFPTSAIFTFHEFVAPVLRAWGGRPSEALETVPATLPVRINSDRGRTEYVLVNLVPTEAGVAAYPLGKGSGSVTTFSHADGFVTLEAHTELVPAGSRVAVHPLGRHLAPADLVVIGSHCVGLDFLVGRLQARGFRTKLLHVGSTAGLQAARRGECDLAGIHLMDPGTGVYNTPFLTPDLLLVPGYRRRQGLVFRADDPRATGHDVSTVLDRLTSDAGCLMINRNAGSGTRILIDRLLAGRQPPGYAVQPRSHNAVAAAIAQGRADWGVAIEGVARDYGLEFLPLQDEHYDFVVPRSRAERPAVQQFRALLQDAEVRQDLARRGLRCDEAACHRNA